MKKVLLLLLVVLAFAGCKKSKPKPSYRVVVLGNSITYSPANPSVGWNGSWGMAASALEKDYVHILSSRFKASNGGSELMFKNIAEFENNFDTYNVSANLKTYADFKPDILILRIGENVTRNTEESLFEQKYIALLNYFKSANPYIKILAAGSVWPDREMSDRVLKRNSTYISLDEMHTNLSYFAFGQFSNPGIESHPSDKGMQHIADRIWEGISQIVPGL